MITVLYEDNHVIAVHKPAGMLVQGDATGDDSLLDRVKAHLKRAHAKPGRVFLGLVHRLDRPVAGVVIFAKTSKGASRLAEQIRGLKMTKVYWAMVHGTLTPAQGTMESYLSRDEKGGAVTAAGAPGAKKAVLDYQTLRAWGDRSLVEVTLVTGRKHQIRVQLAAAGCPVVGDVKYGAPQALPDHSIQLLAKSITFKHPTRAEMITVETSSPAWLKR